MAQLTDIQQTQVSKWLRKFHKHADSINDAAWFEDAESSFNDGDSAFVFEIPASKSVTGQTEILHIPVEMK